MSTDDLTARARRWLTDALPHNPRGLVSELADEVDRLRDENDALNDAVSNNYGHALTMQDLAAERDAARAALEAGDASDGFHTHNELYEYRMLYNAHAAHGWLTAGIPVVKSWKHSDGEPCFGGGWFIVVATLPTGQVSNHYQAEHWDLFHVPEVDLPPEYDGHSPADAGARLRKALEGES